MNRYICKQMIRVQLESLEVVASLLDTIHLESVELSTRLGRAVCRLETGVEGFNYLFVREGTENELIDELIGMKKTGHSLKRPHTLNEIDELLSYLADSVLASARLIEECLQKLWEKPWEKPWGEE